MSKHPFEHFNLDENLIEAVKISILKNRLKSKIESYRGFLRNKFNRTISKLELESHTLFFYH